ncbi:MAG: hypothetical protein HFE84_05815 [Lachnospiraceae bacterium]|nr:hypothetical protein [Lachnospiraceae bacterium]
MAEASFLKCSAAPFTPRLTALNVELAQVEDEIEALLNTLIGASAFLMSYANRKDRGAERLPPKADKGNCRSLLDEFHSFLYPYPYHQWAKDRTVLYHKSAFLRRYSRSAHSQHAD